MALSDIFLAYDIRGKVGPDLNSDSAYKIARVFADWLPEDGPVAVGYDMRPQSKEFAEAIARGLSEQGRDVWNLGQVATDMVYFAVGRHKLAGGAMVTASHNPSDYNGIKLVREEAKGISLDQGLDEIRDAVINNSFDHMTTAGEVINKDIMEGWIEHVLSFIDVNKMKPFKVAIDAGNGMAGAVIPQIANKLPLKITEMFFELDGSFPNHPANPLEPANIRDLQAKVTDEKLDLGIAFDADGDRMALVDEQGKAVSGSIITAILAEYFLKKEPDAVITYNIICGRIVPETIESNGGRAIRTRVGHSFIKQAMRSHNALFGGEHSMHYYFRNNWFADSGLIAAIVLLVALSERGGTMSEYTAKFDTYHQIPETNFEVANKQEVIDKLAGDFADGEQDTLDGLRVDFENSWFNVRPSNTEPLLRLNAEAASSGELDKLVDRIKEAAGF